MELVSITGPSWASMRWCLLTWRAGANVCTDSLITTSRAKTSNNLICTGDLLENWNKWSYDHIYVYHLISSFLFIPGMEDIGMSTTPFITKLSSSRARQQNTFDILCRLMVGSSESIRNGERTPTSRYWRRQHRLAKQSWWSWQTRQRHVSQDVRDAITPSKEGGSGADRSDYWITGHTEKNELFHIQVFLKEGKEDGEALYLSIRTNSTTWSITNNLESKSCYLQSSSAGRSCPAAPSNAISVRAGQKNWLFLDDNGELKEGGIKLFCDAHKYSDKLCIGIDDDDDEHSV